MNIIINTVIFYILWIAMYQDKLEPMVAGIIKFGINYPPLESENFRIVMQATIWANGGNHSLNIKQCQTLRYLYSTQF